MTAFATVYSRRFGCKYRGKKARRTAAGIMLLWAKVGFVLTVGFIGVVMGLNSRESDASRLAGAALFLHQTRDTKVDSAKPQDSAPRRAAKVAAIKRKATPEAAKRAANLVGN
jgi:hypothetical protein